MDCACKAGEVVYMRDDDERRHLSKWFKCPECRGDVRARIVKLCETCKTRKDYLRRKEVKNVRNKTRLAKTDDVNYKRVG